MGRREGLDNDHPRKHVHQLEGLPLRLRSAHYALMENFPGKFLSSIPSLHSQIPGGFNCRIDVQSLM